MICYVKFIGRRSDNKILSFVCFKRLEKSPVKLNSDGYCSHSNEYKNKSETYIAKYWFDYEKFEKFIKKPFFIKRFHTSHLEIFEYAKKSYLREEKLKRILNELYITFWRC